MAVKNKSVGIVGARALPMSGALGANKAQLPEISFGQWVELK